MVPTMKDRTHCWLALCPGQILRSVHDVAANASKKICSPTNKRVMVFIQRAKFRFNTVQIIRILITTIGIMNILSVPSQNWGLMC